MKKLLLILFILILLLVLFLFFWPRNDQQGQPVQQNQTAITEVARVETSETENGEASKADAASVTTSPTGLSATTPASKLSTSGEAPLWLSSHIAVEDAWVTAPPPGSNVAAAYMKISNKGRGAVKFVGVASDDFDDMMFHRTVIEDGVASMQHVDFLELGLGLSFELEPGGLHIMAMNPQRELKPGDQVAISFMYESGHSDSIMIPVR